LRERVRTQPYEIAIVCELKSGLRGDAEECEVKVIAEAPDGHRLVRTHSGWVEKTSKTTARRISDVQEILVYDSTALERIPTLLEGLKLKSSPYVESLVLKVTRKFPEIFAAWLKTVPPQIKVQLKGELDSFATAEVAGRVKLDVTETEIDWFDLRVGLDVA